MTPLPLTVQAVIDVYQPEDPPGFVAALLSAGFSCEAYRTAHQDIREQISSADAAGEHFIRHGVAERRTFPITLNIKALESLSALRTGQRLRVVELMVALTNAYAAGLESPVDLFAPFVLDVLSGLKPLGCRPYLLIGDSHSLIHRRAAVRSGQWLAPVHVLCIGGSALGLGNPASKSGYGSLIKRVMAQIEAQAPAGSALPVILVFGQVDTEFVFNFRRVRSGQRAFDMAAFESFCRESIDAYLRFLTDVFRQDRRSKVTIASILPPAVSDAKLRDGYVNSPILSLESTADENAMRQALRQLEWPDLKTRTSLHAYYNSLLWEACSNNGFRFTETFSCFLGSDGVLESRFVPETRGSDHHLEFKPTRAEIESTLWRVLDSVRE
jgi:hypothetical protein